MTPIYGVDVERLGNNNNNNNNNNNLNNNPNPIPDPNEDHRVSSPGGGLEGDDFDFELEPTYEVKGDSADMGRTNKPPISISTNKSESGTPIPNPTATASASASDTQMHDKSGTSDMDKMMHSSLEHGSIESINTGIGMGAGAGTGRGEGGIRKQKRGYGDIQKEVQYTENTSTRVTEYGNSVEFSIDGASLASLASSTGGRGRPARSRSPSPSPSASLANSNSNSNSPNRSVDNLQAIQAADVQDVYARATGNHIRSQSNSNSNSNIKRLKEEHEEGKHQDQDRGNRNYQEYQQRSLQQSSVNTHNHDNDNENNVNSNTRHKEKKHEEKYQESRHQEYQQSSTSNSNSNSRYEEKHQEYHQQTQQISSTTITHTERTEYEEKISSTSNDQFFSEDILHEFSDEIKQQELGLRKNQVQQLVHSATELQKEENKGYGQIQKEVKFMEAKAARIGEEERSQSFLFPSAE